MQRIEYIDIMRGIGILLVILQHCIGNIEEPLSRFILTVHMPLFFFISGFCMKSGGIKQIVRKTKTILIPQITLCVITLATTVLLDVVLSKSTSLAEIDIFNVFLQMWFLPVLFCMELIMILILCFCKKRYILLLITIGIVLIFNNTDYSTYNIVQQTLGALVFGLIGFLLRPSLDCYTQLNTLYKGLGWLLLMLVAFLSVYNEPIGIYINQYGNKLVFIIIALIAILAIADISLSICNSRFLQWLGKNSIFIYVIQFLIVRIMVAIFSRLIPETGYPYYFLPFFVSLFICVCLVPMLNRYTPLLFGKSIRQ